MKNIHILILSLFLCTNSIAQTIITDRPDQTESSSVIQLGSLQIESGILIVENHNHREKQLYLPTTLFRLGLTNTIELRVLNQFEYKLYEDMSINGFNNLECGLKIQLLRKENTQTELAFLSHIIFPTASELFNENEFSIINKLCVSHAFSENMSFGYNIGYNHHNNETGDFTYSIVYGYGINKKISVYIEPYGEIMSFEKHVSNINTGITYLLRDNIQLDYSFGTGLNNQFNFMSIGGSINVF